MQAIRVSSIRYLAELVISICLVTLITGGKSLAEERSNKAISALAYDKATGQIFKLQGPSIFVSSDDGRSWTELNLPDEVKNPVAFSVSADGHTYYLAESGRGIFRKGKNEEVWVAVDKGLPSKDVTALTTHATQPVTLYACVSKNGIYRSQNAGKDWRKMDRGPEEVQEMMHTNMPGSMDSGWLYVVTNGRLRLSMDCFCLWRDIGDPEAQFKAIAYDRDQPRHVFAASKQGVLASLNGGQDWQVLSSPSPLVMAITVAPGGGIFIGTVDGKLYQSVDGAKSWVQIGA